jgi:hypothetical protein
MSLRIVIKRLMNILLALSGYRKETQRGRENADV